MPYQYLDAQGPGVLTFVALNASSTRLSFQPIQVTLVQNGVTSRGSGVYHAFPDDLQGNLVSPVPAAPASALVAFTLLTPAGQSFFFQGSIVSGGNAAVSAP